MRRAFMLLSLIAFFICNIEAQEKSGKKLLTREELKTKVMGKTGVELIQLIGRPKTNMSNCMINGLAAPTWIYDNISMDTVTGKKDFAFIQFKNDKVVSIEFGTNSVGNLPDLSNYTRKIPDIPLVTKVVKLEEKPKYSRQQIKDLVKGKKSTEIIELLGKPSFVNKERDAIKWTYFNYIEDSQTLLKENFYVFLKPSTIGNRKIYIVSKITFPGDTTTPRSSQIASLGSTTKTNNTFTKTTPTYSDRKERGEWEKLLYRKTKNQVLEIMGPTIFKRTRVGMTELIYPRRCKSIFSGKDEDVFVGFMDGKVQRVYFKKSSNDYLGQ